VANALAYLSKVLIAIRSLNYRPNSITLILVIVLHLKGQPDFGSNNISSDATFTNIALNKREQYKIRPVIDNKEINLKYKIK
jgi:hypothetical protein